MNRYCKTVVCSILFLVSLLPCVSFAADLELEKQMQQDLADCLGVIVKMDEKIKSGNSIAPDVSRLKALSDDIRVSHLLIEERFKIRQERINSTAGPNAIERHSAMQKAYNDVLQQYLEIMNSISSEADISPSVLENLRGLLDRVFYKKKIPIIGSLPYSHLDYASKMPQMEPAIIPAYKGGDKNVSADDTAGAPEAPVTHAISTLAQSLDWNPVRIYEWVKNNVETEWYWGLMKGAEETLNQKSGNDCDQAALLVALLRASGYPARYVRGVMEFFPDIEKAKNLTGVDDPKDLPLFFQKAGIPFSPVIAGGKIKNIQIEHIWVETQIPYANYRGAIIDENGKTWLGLDTAIKAEGYTQNTPEDIPVEISLPAIRAGYLEGVHDETPVEYLRARIGDYFTQAQSGKIYGDLLLKRTLKPEDMKILPAGLQFKQAAITNEYKQIPDELIHKARFKAADEKGNELFDITLEAFKLSNKPIVITYEPETVEDQETINSYGGLGNTPSYLVRLRSVLKVNGERVAIGADGLAMGEDYEIETALISPNGEEKVNNSHIIGNISVVGLVSQKAIMPANIPDKDRNAERLLYEEAISYIDRWNRSEDELASLLRLSISRPMPAMVTVGGVIDVSYLLDTPHGIEWKGVYVDADLRDVEVCSGYPQNGVNSQKIFMEFSALEGSVLENRIFEDNFHVGSISTAKLFGVAGEANVPILVIDSSNLDEVIAGLPFDRNIIEDIINAVNQGLIVRIPQHGITYEDWTGTGYIKEGPATGESGWMLTGMIAGGMTAWGIDRWPEYFAQRLSNPFSESESYDPQSDCYIHKITATDMQKGTVGDMLSSALQVLVRDSKNTPVSGADVTFTVKAGGGKFGNGQTSVTVKTNFNGIASADFRLGEKTSANPTYWWEEGYTFHQQVGENIVDAALISGRTITAPFVAYGFPGEANRIAKIYSVSERRPVLSWAGMLSIIVEDRFGNAVSNLPVAFQTQPATSSSTCQNPNQDDRQALLVKKDDPCINNIPNWGDCATGAASMQEISNSKGAAVQVILGGIPYADYPIRVSTGNIAEIFTLRSLGFGNCTGDYEPSNWLILSYIYTSDMYGNNIVAAKPGAAIPIKGKLRYLREHETTIPGDMHCSDTLMCGKIVGSREYYNDTDFKSASLTFNGQAGAAEGNGVYGANYILNPGVNTITLDSTATVEKNRVTCNNCEVVKEDVTLSTDTTMTLYGVDIETEEEITVPVDEEGYVTCDTPIKYTITPSEYKAGTAYVIIYKDGNPISYIPTETQGEGFGLIARGFKFDLKSDYEAYVVLNPGSGVEIKGNRISLSAGDIQVKEIYLEDEKSAVSQGESVKAIAITTPGDRTIIWSIESRQDGVRAEIDPSTGKITAEEESRSGYIVVRATDSEVACIYKESRIYIGCPCSACNVAVNGALKNESIDVSLSLGKAKGGQVAGELFIHADEPSVLLATSKALRLSTLSRGIDARYDEDGYLRQVLSSQSFADIVAVSKFCYEIRFYHSGDVGGEHEGLYVPKTGAQPFVTWKMENPDASLTEYKRLRVTEIKDGKTIENEYVWDEVKKGFTLSQANGLKMESRTEVLDEALNNRIVTHTVKDGSGRIASTVKTTYHTFEWGEEIVETMVDPDGEALVSTIIYYEEANQAGSYGKVKYQVNADGSQEGFQYDEQGRKTVKESGWLDNPGGRITRYGYEAVDVNDGQAPDYARQPRVVTEEIMGVVVSKTYYAYLADANGDRTEIVERCASPASAYGAVGNQRIVTTYFASGTELAGAGKIKAIVYPDGRMDSYTYEYGQYNPNGDQPGSFTPGSGSDMRETVVHGTVSNPQGVANKSTREISIQSEHGNELMRETQVYTGSGYERLQWTVQQYDEFNHVTDVFNSDGTHSESVWGCCGKESETDARGVSMVYTYDALKRVETMVKVGSQGYITTRYTYDAEGRRLTETVSAGGLSLMSSNQYDPAGRVKSSTDSAGLVTGYGYDEQNRTDTVTRSGGASEITARYIDGRTKSITGTGVVPRYYEYGVNSDGGQWTKVYAGGFNSPMWEKTTTDMLGRTIKVEKPGYAGVESTENFYNDKGQVVRMTMPGQADSLYSYDELGNQLRSGLDVNNNGILEEASTDRINDSETSYVHIDGAWWQETVSRVYATENEAIFTTVGRQRSQVSGLGLGGVVNKAVSIDVHGNQSMSTTTVDRTTKTETRTIDYPDSDINEISVTVNGLVASATGKTGVTVSYDYDALGRQTGVTDPRIGTSTTHYNAKGQVDYIEDAAGNRTTYTYDPNTGQKTAETNAMNKVIRYAYNVQGQVFRTWGDSAYPVEYVYDGYSHMTEMHTFRNEAGWTWETWPATGIADITKWHYQESTGLLLSKEDAEGNSASYTYETGGKLDTRTWARNNGSIVTDYNYDPNTGELVNINYSDTTPDVTFTYNRLGRQKTVADAVGNRIFAYNNSLQLESETINGLYNKVITRNYEITGVIGRSSGFTIGADYTINYGYSTNGRFGSVGWNVGSSTGLINYSYVPNSDLLHQQTALNGHKVTYSYDPHRDLKTQVKNEFNSQLISQYDYLNDSVGRRTSVQNSGNAFSQSAFNKYGYNDRSELTGSNRYLGTDINDLGQPVDPEKRVYGYDPIGNRTNATEGLTSKGYNTNNLNQYSNITEGSSVQTPTYDLDGNMTSAVLAGSERTMSYDAENRLIVVEPLTASEGDKKVEFIYDYMGRRVKKTAFTFSSGSWLLDSEFLFAYDGWNLIAETTGGDTRYFVWGLDLSQSLQGAGGIGGLMAVVDSGETYLYFYDANGNVGQLVKASDGTIAAHYEYDPYGNTIFSSGTEAGSNPYRFSTKYFDQEPDLYYYGYRYYSPAMGRWLIRDPAMEHGSLNLYLFLNNSGIGEIDYLGLIGVSSMQQKLQSYYRQGSKYTIELWLCILAKENWDNNNFNRTPNKDSTAVGYSQILEGTASHIEKSIRKYMNWYQMLSSSKSFKEWFAKEVNPARIPYGLATYKDDFDLLTLLKDGEPLYQGIQRSEEIDLKSGGWYLQDNWLKSGGKKGAVRAYGDRTDDYTNYVLNCEKCLSLHTNDSKWYSIVFDSKTMRVMKEKDHKECPCEVLAKYDDQK